MPAANPVPDSHRRTVYALLGLSLILLAYPILRIGFDFEIDNNEGWDAFLQVRAMAGLSLYRFDTPYFVNDYPPLSFYVVGAVARLVGDPVVAGRMVSVLGLVSLAFACAHIVRTLGGSRLDATLAWATCVALFASFGTDYVGINDPHMWGQSLFLWCLALYLRVPPSVGFGIGLAILVSFAVLTKHNMLAVPILVSIDLLRRWPLKAKLAYFGAGFALAGLAAGLMWLLAGHAFFHSLFAGRTYDVARGFLMTTNMLAKLQAPVAAVGLALILARRERPHGLIAAYLGLALFEGAFFTGGANDDINHFFEVFAAVAIGAGLAVHRFGPALPAPIGRAVLALVVNAGVLFHAPLSIGRMVVDVAGEMAEREKLFRADVEFARAEKGLVLCQSFLLCFRAGKPMYFDPHNVRQMMFRGDLPKDLETGMVERREIALMQVEDRREHPLDEYPGKQAMPAFFIHFNDDVFDALDRHYKVARVGIMGRFLVPKTEP